MSLIQSVVKKACKYSITELHNFESLLSAHILTTLNSKYTIGCFKTFYKKTAQIKMTYLNQKNVGM